MSVLWGCLTALQILCPVYDVRVPGPSKYDNKRYYFRSLELNLEMYIDPYGGRIAEEQLRYAQSDHEDDESIYWFKVTEGYV